MSTRRLFSFRRFTLCLALWLLVGPVRAQQCETPPPEYRKHIDRAFSESAEGRWDEARAAFRNAHEIFPNARTLRGIGMVAFELRDYVDAHRNWKAALDEPCRALSQEQRAQVRELLVRVRGFLAEYSTAELPEGATIAVDGRRIQPEPDQVVLLALGSHEVLVEADGLRGKAELQVRGGEVAPLPIALAVVEGTDSTSTEGTVDQRTDLHPASLHSSPSPQPSAQSTTQRGPSSARRGRSIAFPLSLVLGGAVSVGAGLGLLLAGHSEKRAAENPEPGTDWSAVNKSDRRATTLTATGGALLGLGALTTAAGAGLWLSPSFRAGGRQDIGLVMGGTF